MRQFKPAAKIALDIRSRYPWSSFGGIAFHPGIGTATLFALFMPTFAAVLAPLSGSSRTPLSAAWRERRRLCVSPKSGPGGIRTSGPDRVRGGGRFLGPCTDLFLSRNDARLSARLRTEMGCPKTRYLFSPDVRFPGQVKGDDQCRGIPWLKARA